MGAVQGAVLQTRKLGKENAVGKCVVAMMVSVFFQLGGH